MKLQFKEQDFQVKGVKAVVDCFQGQPIKTNRFTLERSKELIRKTKMAASGVTQVSAFDDEVLEDIGYRNSAIQIPESQILKNIQANEVVRADLSGYASGIYLIRYPLGKQWVSGKVVLSRR